MTQNQAFSTQSAPSIGRWVAIVIVLAGLFGMHGLAGHGSESAEMGMGDTMVALTRTAATAATEIEAATHPNPTPQAAALTSSVASGLVGAMSGTMSGGAMSTLCLAVLTAAALLVLLGARRTWVALARVLTPAPFGVFGVGRDRGPPSLTALSIRRC